MQLLYQRTTYKGKYTYWVYRYTDPFGHIRDVNFTHKPTVAELAEVTKTISANPTFGEYCYHLLTGKLTLSETIINLSWSLALKYISIILLLSIILILVIKK